MFKKWLREIFYGNRVLLVNILIELRNLHYHLDRMEILYMMVNKIKEDKEENKNDGK
jgi:hypothetical protein